MVAITLRFIHESVKQHIIYTAVSKFYFNNGEEQAHSLYLFKLLFSQDSS